jgi:hypothetical protein
VLMDAVVQRLPGRKKRDRGLTHLTGYPPFVAPYIKHTCISEEFPRQERKAGIASTRVLVEIPKMHYSLLTRTPMKRTHGSCGSSHASGRQRKRRSCYNSTGRVEDELRPVPLFLS